MGAFPRFESADLVCYDQLPFDHRFERIIGESPALEALLEQVKHVAPIDVTVLIQGKKALAKS